MNQRGELRDLATIFRAKILDVSAHAVTIEHLGKEDKMQALTELLQPYGACGRGGLQPGWRCHAVLPRVRTREPC